MVGAIWERNPPVGYDTEKVWFERGFEPSRFKVILALPANGGFDGSELLPLARWCETNCDGKWWMRRKHSVGRGEWVCRAQVCFASDDDAALFRLTWL